MHIRSRRRILICACATLALVDGFMVLNKDSAPFLQIWTIYMPAVEREQIEGPPKLLFSSHYWDPRIPASSTIDPSFDPEKPSMLRDFVKCKPAKVIIEWGENDPDMPVRYYLHASDERAANCARAALPEGYEIISGRPY